jgi:hypothetical protein
MRTLKRYRKKSFAASIFFSERVSYAFLPLRLLRPRYVTGCGSWGSSVTYGYGEIYSRNVRNALSTLIRLDFELIGHEPVSAVFEVVRRRRDSI